MFGGLKQYTDETYGKNHSIICFDSLYEQREYQLIAVFYSQVFNNTDKVFKYYNFFQADTQRKNLMTGMRISRLCLFMILV